MQQPPNELDDIEWLSILQHHGGITRLLDCTHSFYVALYFALESSLTHACVWCISAEKLRVTSIAGLKQARLIHTRSIDVEDDLKYHEGRGCAQAFVGFPDVSNNVVIPVTPYRLNERMSIQQGIFLFPTNLAITFQDNLFGMFDVMNIETLNWLTPYWNDCDVIKLTIPVSCHKGILTDLRRMNITVASLFPGLDGYARSLKYNLRIFEIPEQRDKDLSIQKRTSQFSCPS